VIRALEMEKQNRESIVATSLQMRHQFGVTQWLQLGKT
jgi:hypothetical protein